MFCPCYAIATENIWRLVPFKLTEFIETIFVNNIKKW